jgi:small lipoprotein (TIGR04454 family)
MKNLLVLAAFAALLFTVNCKDNSVSEAECTPVVQTMFENFSKLAPEGDIEKAKMVLIPMLQKECQSGKYELQCLAGAKSIQELQLCKKN